MNNIERSYEISLDYIEKQIQDLESEIVSINKKAANFDKDWKKLLSISENDSDIVSLLLSTNAVQRKFEFQTNSMYKILDLYRWKVSQKEKIISLENERQKSLIEIDYLESKKTNIQNIQIIREPKISASPIKPNIRLNVIIAIFVGIFITTFLAFVLEYNVKTKKLEFKQ